MQNIILTQQIWNIETWQTSSLKPQHPSWTLGANSNNSWSFEMWSKLFSLIPDHGQFNINHSQILHSYGLESALIPYIIPWVHHPKVLAQVLLRSLNLTYMCKIFFLCNQYFKLKSLLLLCVKASILMYSAFDGIKLMKVTLHLIVNH